MELETIKESIKQKPFFETPNGLLYCADCLEIMKQMPDGCVDLVVTDPPYGVSYKQSGEIYMVGDTINLFPYFLPKIRKLLKDDGAVYIFSSTTKLVDVLPQFQTYFKMHSLIIWDKGIGQIPRQLSHYKLRYEPILYGSKGLHRLLKYKDDVMVEPIVRGNNRVHPTQKPEEVILYFIENSTIDKNNAIEEHRTLIFDPFLGSGTTCVVAERLNRRWIGIEISEKYCAIAQKRIEGELEKKKQQSFKFMDKQ